MTISEEEQQELVLDAPLETASGPARRRRGHALAVCALLFGIAVVVAAATSAPRTGHKAAPEISTAAGITQLQEEPKCEVFWHMKARDMIAQGWGSRVLNAATFYQRFHLWADECTFYTSWLVAKEWKSWGLTVPFEVMSLADWAVAQADPSVQAVDASFKVTLRGPWRGEAPDTAWSLMPTTLNLVYSDFAGCWDDSFDAVLEQMTKEMMKERPKVAPRGDYIGLHVRHGDKKVEGPLASFQGTMGLATSHSDLKSVFLATDDATVVAGETPQYKEAGFEFTWTNWSRTAGGEPKTCSGLWCHHNSEDSAVEAVLADTLALAHASVLVGSFNSNFFKFAWMLNWLRRSYAERTQDWCYDIATGLACNDRHEFVVQFIEQARAGGWGVLPDPSTASVRDCTSPMATRRLGAGRR